MRMNKHHQQHHTGETAVLVELVEPTSHHTVVFLHTYILLNVHIAILVGHQHAAHAVKRPGCDSATQLRTDRPCIRLDTNAR